MENKSNYLLKLICLVGIFVLLIAFVLGFTNLGNTVVEQVSVEEMENGNESFSIAEKPKQILTEIVKENSEEGSQPLENDDNLIIEQENVEIKNTEEIPEIKYIETELNAENCEYKLNSENSTIEIEEYKGDDDCVVIPEEIDGNKIEDIDTSSFSDCYNLETIKIAKEIAEKIDEIPDFEINEELEEENYVVYTTTREYGKAYQYYIGLSEEEKAEVAVIPNKFDVPIENVYSEKMQNLYTIGSIDTAYDLRDDINIKVENQNPYGICYAYASLSSVETFWSLNKNESIDFSDMHAAILTDASGGYLFRHNDTYGYYANQLGPVYEEDYAVNDIKTEALSNYSSIHNCLNADSPSSYTSVQNYAKQKSAEKLVLETVRFSSVGYEYKSNSTYAAYVKTNRNNIKSHIKQYGSVATLVRSVAIVEYNGNYVCNHVSSTYYNEYDHAVSIVGWDDNYPKENFPSSCRPSEDGAYLILNSWGESWGDNGYFWMSYEDSVVEYNTVGVISAKEIAENLQASEIVVTDVETGEILDNGFIPDGTKIKINIDVEVTDEISGEELEIKLRDRENDLTSLMTVTGDNLINKKANLEMLVDTGLISGNQQILEISYGTETVSKMIETPQEFLYTVNADGTITIVEYEGPSKEVVIPGEYDGYKVSTLGKDIFNGAEIEKLTLSEGITTIEPYALRYAYKLKELNLPSTLKTIGEGGFFMCYALEEVVIPRSVTSLGLGMVQQCTSLNKIVIFKETTSIGGYMFNNTPATIYCEAGSAALTYAIDNSYSYSVITDSYNITYNKNAGTDTVINMPSTQNKVKYDTVKISDNKPERTNYKFLGWAKSSTATEAEYVSGEFYKTDANLNLYAVWEQEAKNASYNIEYYKDGVKDAEETITKLIPADDTVISVEKDGINTINKYLGYTFEKTEPAEIPDAINIGDTIKVYYVVENYTITYDLQGGNLPEGKNNPTTYTVNDSFTINNPEKVGYAFAGWNENGGAEKHTTITISKGSTGNKSYKANYNVNSYKVTVEYVYEDGSKALDNVVQTVEYGQSYNIKTPEKAGYTASKDEVSGIMGNEDKTVTVTYVANTNTKYKVEHYKENIENDEYSLFETENKEGTTDTNTVAESKGYEGFTVQEFVQQNINGDESTVIKIYYDRNEYSLTVKYEYSDGSKVADDVVQTLKYEQSYKVTTPVKAGYTVSKDEVSGTMENEDKLVIVTYSANANTKYKVEHYKENIENEEYTLFETENKEGTTDTNTVAESKGYEGFTVQEFVQQNINGDESTVIKIYYDRNEYSLTVKYEYSDGSKVADDVVQILKYEQSYKITSPEKVGYTAAISEVSGTMGNEDKLFTVTYSANTNTPYKVEHYKQNRENNEYTLFETEYKTGTTNTNTTAEEKGYEGFTPKGITQENINPDGSTVVKIYYDINYYTVTVRYLYEDGTKALEDLVQQVPYGGYFAAGYQWVAGYTPNVMIFEEGYVRNNVIKEFIYSPNTNTKYKVEHYKENIENEEYTLFETENKEGTTDTNTVAESKGYEGFTVQEFTQANINGDESTVVKIYYDRNEYSLTVKYEYSDGSKVADDVVQTLKYEQSYKVTSPVKAGYTATISEVSGTKSAENETITVVYTANTNTKYKVEHYKQNIENDDYTLFETENKEGTTDTNTVAESKGYEGFTVQEFTQANINGDESTVIKIYYERNSYTLTYKVDGVQYGEIETYRFEETITQREKLTKLGYKFNGWNNVLEKMPANNVEVTGAFVANTNTKYKVEHYKQNIENEEYTLFETENKEGTTDTNTVAESKGYEGFTVQEFVQQNINGDESTVIKIYYDRNEYSLTVKYEYTDGSKVADDVVQTLKYEQSYKVTTPVKAGYTATISEVSGTMENENKLVTVTYSANTDTPYVIYHYKQNIENDDYTLFETEDKEGTTDTNTAAESKGYEGFTVQEFAQTNINGDESTVVNVYYNRNTYTVTYKVDGVQYGEIETYRFEETIIQREKPTKLGYKFNGWNNLLEKMPANNIEVSGTYSIDNTQTKDISYKIEYYLENQLEEQETLKQTVQILQNKALVDINKINTTDKFDGYSFIKTEPTEIPEYIEENGIIKVYYADITAPSINVKIDGEDAQNKSELTKYNIANIEIEGIEHNDKKFEVTITKDSEEWKKYEIPISENYGKTTEKLTLEGTYEFNITFEDNSGNISKIEFTIVLEYADYTIRYDLDGGSLEEGKSNPETFSIYDSFTLNNPSKKGHTFIGWTGSNGNIPQINVSIETNTYENKEFKANYTANPYTKTVRYVYEDGREASIPKAYTVEYGQNYKITSPEILGYTASQNEISGVMDDNNETITVIYSANTDTKYKVEHYKENIENEEYTLFETENKEGTTDTNTVAESKGYEGFTVQEFAQTNINGDESTVIKIYYDRNEYSLTVKYEYSDGSKVADDVVQTLKYEQSYKVTSPVKAGYTATISEVSGTMENEDKLVIVTYSANTNTKYKVEHYKENIENDEYTLFETENKEGTTDTSTVAESKGYEGFRVQEFVQQNINGDESTVIKIYYDRNEYLLTVKYEYSDGSKVADDVVQTLKYEQSYKTTSPVKAGYTVSKDEVSGTMENEDKLVIVTYSANTNTKYKVEHYKENIENDEYTLFETENKEGTTDTNTVAESKGYEGFTVQEFTQANINGDESTVIKIYYDRNEYSLTVKYEYSDGSKVADDVVQTLKYEQSYKVRTPVKAGYTVSKDEVSGTKSAENETITVVYTANTDTPYVVYHYKQNIENDDYTLFETENKEGTTDTNTAAESKGYEGFRVQEFAQTNINGDESTVVNVYYNRNTYTVKYKVDGVQYGEIETYRFEETIIQREKPTKLGYKFNGWNNLLEKMPANNIEVSGTYSIDNTQTKDISYKIEYYTENELIEEGTVKQTVQVLEKRILLDRNKINTTDKFEGYNFIKTEPSEIPEYISDGETIKIYYSDITYPVINAIVDDVEVFNNTYMEKSNVTNVEIKGFEYNTEKFEIVIKKNNEEYKKEDIEIEDGNGSFKERLTEEGEYEFFVTMTDAASNISTINFKIKVEYTNYEISYDLQGGILEEGIKNPETYNIKDSFTLNNPSKKGHTFIGWTGSNGENPQETVRVELGTEGNKEYKANYRVNTYTKTIKYIYEDGSEAAEEKSITSEYGKDYRIETPEILGYTPTVGEFSGTMDDVDETIVVTYIANIDTLYKVEYYKQNIENNDYVLEDIVNMAGTTNTQTEVILKEYKGFIAKEYNEETIKGDGTTIVKIYYDRIVHTVTYKIDGEIYGEVENYKFGQEIIQRENPTKLGYSFSGWSEIPEIMLLEDIVIEGSFVLDETQAKEIGYTIEFYKVNEKVDSDTIEVKQTVHVLEPDELTVDKSQINITDKYEGYKFERTEPEIIPDTIENGGVIKVFYREEIYSYTVKYYYDGIEDESARETKEARKGQMIEGYVAKTKPGYELQRVENSNLVITDNPENNIINVYYVRKTGKVIVEYRDFITGEEISSKIVKYGKVFDKYNILNAKAELSEYVLMEEPKTLSGEFTEEDQIKVFKYAKKSKVIINYIDKNSNERISDPSVIEGFETKEYETKQKDIIGYTFAEKTENTKGKMTKENIQVTYYYIKNTIVKVEYIEKATGNKISEDRIIEGLEGDTYKVDAKQIDGYKLLDEKENTEGTMAHNEIVARFYYEKIKVETPEEDKKEDAKDEAKDETITSNDYTIKEEKITKISSETNISDFKKHISSKSKITVYNTDGKEAKENEIIKTGMKLKSEDGKEYDLIVRGDISCDGKVSLVDLSKLILHYNEKKGFILSGCSNSAADMNGDGKVSLIDISQMLVLYNSK